MSFLSKIFGNPSNSSQKSDDSNYSENPNIQVRSGQIAANISSNISTQIGLIQETSGNFQQIRSLLSQSESQINECLKMTLNIHDRNLERGKTLDRLQTAMDSIKSSNELLVEVLKSFEAIQSKTRKINDIVAKTQLLSFNASIEAARAGQLGKGFSVVAEEVGRLAQSSGLAAKEIDSLLLESQIKATSVIDTIFTRSDEGVSVCGQVKQSFNELTKSISSISDGLEKANQTSRDQFLNAELSSNTIERIHQSALKCKRSSDDLMRLGKQKTASHDLKNSKSLASLMESIEAPTIKGELPKVDFSTDKFSADDPTFKNQE